MVDEINKENKLVHSNDPMESIFQQKSFQQRQFISSISTATTPVIAPSATWSLNPLPGDEQIKTLEFIGISPNGTVNFSASETSVESDMKTWIGRSCSYEGLSSIDLFAPEHLKNKNFNQTIMQVNAKFLPDESLLQVSRNIIEKRMTVEKSTALITKKL